MKSKGTPVPGNGKAVKSKDTLVSDKVVKSPSSSDFGPFPSNKTTSNDVLLPSSPLPAMILLMCRHPLAAPFPFPFVRLYTARNISFKYPIYLVAAKSMGDVVLHVYERSCAYVPDKGWYRREKGR